MKEYKPMKLILIILLLSLYFTASEMEYQNLRGNEYVTSD